MIEASKAIVKPGAMKKFFPVPSDKYQVQITDVNLINQVNTFSGKEEELCNFEFTILTDNSFDYVDEEGQKQIESTRGRRLWKRMRPTLSAGSSKSKASWMYKLLCAVEKEEIPPEKLQEVDVNSLVGTQVLVMVDVVKEQFNNILSFAPAKEELKSVPNAVDRIANEQMQEEELDEVAEKLKGQKVEDLKEKELDEVFAKG